MVRQVCAETDPELEMRPELLVRSLLHSLDQTITVEGQRYPLVWLC